MRIIDILYGAISLSEIFIWFQKGDLSIYIMIVLAELLLQAIDAKNLRYRELYPEDKKGCCWVIIDFLLKPMIAVCLWLGISLEDRTIMYVCIGLIVLELVMGCVTQPILRGKPMIVYRPVTQETVRFSLWFYLSYACVLIMIMLIMLPSYHSQFSIEMAVLVLMGLSYGFYYALLRITDDEKHRRKFIICYYLAIVSCIFIRCVLKIVGVLNIFIIIPFLVIWPYFKYCSDKTNERR